LFHGEETTRNTRIERLQKEGELTRGGGTLKALVIGCRQWFLLRITETVGGCVRWKVGENARTLFSLGAILSHAYAPHADVYVHYVITLRDSRS